jgi:hypothetical protein
MLFVSSGKLTHIFVFDCDLEKEPDILSFDSWKIINISCNSK